MAPPPTHVVGIRTMLRPGDIGSIVRMHGVIYAQEHGFDVTFEAYVAGPLAEFALRSSPRERIWIAERDGRVVGSSAVVEVSADVAQLRWFLVDPDARHTGLGTTLLRETVGFGRACGYASMILWTVDRLDAAARLYRAAGFERVEQLPGRHWGLDVVEEKYELRLR